MNTSPSPQISATAAKSSAPLSPDDSFARILQLVRAVQNGMQNISTDHAVSGSQLWALWHISAQPGMRVSDLAKAMQIRQSTASNLLDKLEERAFIRRERQTRDTRVVCVFLTPAGQIVVRDVPGPMQGRMRNALQQLSASELKGLERGIARLMELLNSAH